MNKKTLPLSVSVLAVVVLAFTMSPTYATKPTTVNGNRLTTGFTPTGGWGAGESHNVILYVSATRLWQGDIAGADTSDAIRIIHNFPDGPTNVRIVSIFSSVTIMGKTGELTMVLNFVVEAETETIKGSWIIVSGTGDLANLHGGGKLFGSQYAASYSGQVHFNP